MRRKDSASAYYDCAVESKLDGHSVSRGKVLSFSCKTKKYTIEYVYNGTTEVVTPGQMKKQLVKKKTIGQTVAVAT